MSYFTTDAKEAYKSGIRKGRCLCEEEMLGSDSVFQSGVEYGKRIGERRVLEEASTSRAVAAERTERLIAALEANTKAHNDAAELALLLDKWRIK